MSIEGSVEGRFQLGIDQDIESARVLIEDLPWRNNPLRYRKAAEVILRRILGVDPANEHARTLLAKAETVPQEVFSSTPQVIESSAPALATPHAIEPPAPLLFPRAVESVALAPQTLPSIDPPAAPLAPRVEEPPKPAPALQPPPRSIAPPAPTPLAEDLPFVVDPQVERTEETFEKREWRIPVAALIALAVVVIGGVVVWRWQRLTPSTAHYDPKPAVAQVAGDASVDASVDTSKDAAASPRDQFVTSALPALPPSPDLSIPTLAPPKAPVAGTAAAPSEAAVVVKPSVPIVAPIQTGTLAVSSPTTVDIYMGDRFLGSAPITLDLPAGTQRLEYRHQDMRKVVAQVINPNETTTAMVTFDVGVRINARPWAQVFIEGPRRQALGQTPLSDIQVPIGSLLVFENPNFPGKSYRVTGKEAEIRVNFP